VHAFNIFFEVNGVDDTPSALFFTKKDNASSIIAHNPAIMVFRKIRLLFFQLILIQKNLENTFGTLFGQSMASKKIKNRSKTHN